MSKFTDEQVQAVTALAFISHILDEFEIAKDVKEQLKVLCNGILNVTPEGMTAFDVIEHLKEKYKV